MTESFGLIRALVALGQLWERLFEREGLWLRTQRSLYLAAIKNSLI
jgi:hypothetical protein